MLTTFRFINFVLLYRGIWLSGLWRDFIFVAASWYEAL